MSRHEQFEPVADLTALEAARSPQDLPKGSISPPPAERRASRKGLDIIFWAAVVWAVVIVLAAIFADFLPLKDPIESDFTAIAEPPSWGRPLGTDEVGRDILSRVIYGARISLLIGFVSVFIGLVIGGVFGMIAGYGRGRTERVIMTLTDALLALPALVLLLTVSAVLGQSLPNITIGLAVLSVPTFIRLTRASSLVISQREFVMASRAYGARPIRVMFRDILPNVIPPVAAFAVIIVGVVIVAEGSLSFLGLGVPPPAASWGVMIAGGRTSLTETPHVAMIPSTAMFITVLAFNFIGERLREGLDVRESSL